MDLAIDVGGSKTLLAAFNATGEPIKQFKFPTPEDYEQFQKTLGESLKTEFGDLKFSAAAIAIPGRIDREEGMALGYGTLGWPPAPIKHDLAKILGLEKVLVENDAKLAGLSEANLVKDQYKKVLYVTIGTGIGTALIVDGRIDPALADSEGGQIWIQSGNKKVAWEDIASGRAILARFGQRASDLTDQTAWQSIAESLAIGLFDMIAVVQPQVVIIGGGVGAHFNKFGELLKSELKKVGDNLVPIPPIIQAHRPEEAVIYGCYEFIKQN